jgi:hypothetical protein
VPDLARFRPILWAATGLCLIAGLVAVPVVSDGAEPSAEVRATDGGWVGTVGSDAPTTTAPACDGCGAAPAGDGGDGGDGGGAPAPGAPAGPATTTASTAPPVTAAATTTVPPTTAPPLEDLGSPSDPGPATPPRAGTYRYRLSGAEGAKDTTTVITDKGASGSERRFLYAVRGGDLNADNEVAWRPDGVHVLSTVVMFGTSKGNCDWNPDTVQLKLPLAAGTAWESASTCQMTGLTPAPIPVSRKVTGKVVELRRVRVAGQPVDVWAIEGTERLEGGGQGGERKGVVLFSPKHGVVVSESGTFTAPDGTTSEYRNDIQNLDPE